MPLSFALQAKTTTLHGYNRAEKNKLLPKYQSLTRCERKKFRLKQGYIRGANPYYCQSLLCRAALHAGAVGAEIVVKPEKAACFPAVSCNSVEAGSWGEGMGFNVAAVPGSMPGAQARPGSDRPNSAQDRTRAALSQLRQRPETSRLFRENPFCRSFWRRFRAILHCVWRSSAIPTARESAPYSLDPLQRPWADGTDRRQCERRGTCI